MYLENVDSSWSIVHNKVLLSPLDIFLRDELPNMSYQPAKENIFRVFEKPMSTVRVVILGQDPYPTPGNAIGLAFAVDKEAKIPASLRVIRSEVYEEYQLWWGGSDMSFFQDEEWKTLEHWRRQGVMLLNTALTVETGKAGSHLDKWKDFTASIISYLSSLNNGIVFMLWGKKAQEFKYYIHNNVVIDGIYEGIPTDRNYILQSAHPAAELYSGGKGGFIGCNHFSIANELLRLNKKETILW